WGSRRGTARHWGRTETRRRRPLWEQPAGIYRELVPRPDMRVFLPPIGGITVYLFGDVGRLADPLVRITCRVHDECNGSDVFGSGICPRRPHLVHGVEGCAPAPPHGGLGHFLYKPQEG